MTRHGKNSTASAVYSYHERQRDASASGYGTTRARLGADSQKDFDACSLTLQPCREPVVTPEGFVYDREAILEYILHEKVAIQKRIKRYETAKAKKDDEQAKLAAAAERDREEKFVRLHNSLAAHSSSSSSKSDTNSPSSAGVGSRITNEVVQHTNSSKLSSSKDEAHSRKLASFWVPCMTPNAGGHRTVDNVAALQPPDTLVRCPMSGNPLKTKNLFQIKWTLLDPTDKIGSAVLLAKRDRYKCAVTGDVLSNSTPVAFLKTSGHVVTCDCVERLIRKDMRDPTNGKALKESDIIRLQRGGTGFAATNSVIATNRNPTMCA